MPHLALVLAGASAHISTGHVFCILAEDSSARSSPRHQCHHLPQIRPLVSGCKDECCAHSRCLSFLKVPSASRPFYQPRKAASNGSSQIRNRQKRLHSIHCCSRTSLTNRVHKEVSQKHGLPTFLHGIRLEKSLATAPKNAFNAGRHYNGHRSLCGSGRFFARL